MTSFHFLTLITLPSLIISCDNYWQKYDTSSSRRPFDVCYRSYRNQKSGDYSYNYICNSSYFGNDTVGGHTVFKQYYNELGCNGDINLTVRESVPYAVFCGGSECDLVTYRVYDVDSSENATSSQCNDIDYEEAIKSENNYEELVHVIERCDDDGQYSDSYFCSNDYYYINRYSNENCDNEGIYSAEYHFEGCREYSGNVEYLEMISCAKDSGSTSSSDAAVIAGIIFIIFALVGILCAVAFVVYHCKKGRPYK